MKPEEYTITSIEEDLLVYFGKKGLLERYNLEGICISVVCLFRDVSQCFDIRPEVIIKDDIIFLICKGSEQVYQFTKDGTQISLFNVQNLKNHFWFEFAGDFCLTCFEQYPPVSKKLVYTWK
eukprot:CAMPEP_0117747380 /NCGR_PEP_ID=MMETSP0947-20121206/8469_1 /TAXON_ID=44440 /ORGANISM="Chattonella subsalsa, Strain CCMP2191" /LENGTH=121 /DNA_ID=CAMNT_0005564807 /DNA_START=665 /DNA_END=1030 /DNA_ORIENTATION=-